MDHPAASVSFCWQSNSTCSRTYLSWSPLLLYRLLYSRTGNLRKHPIVTLAFPLSPLFLIYIIYSSYQQVCILGYHGSAYLIARLCWLGTTQDSLGVPQPVCPLEGFRLARSNGIIRGGFLALFLYHIAWAYDSTGFIQQTLSEQDAGKYLMQSVMSLCRLLVAIGFVAGLYGFWTMSQQSNRQIPIRIWLPWAATFSWYAMVDINPAFFLLQIFHALQYLMFIRVEINDYTPRNKRKYHLLIYVWFVAWATLHLNGRVSLLYRSNSFCGSVNHDDHYSSLFH